MAGSVTELGEQATTLRPGLKGFKSSGLHVLEAYITPAGEADGPPGPSTRDAGTTRPSRIWTGHIPADNVGFRLLRKAGWNIGSGLGAGEQGRREPIAPTLPKGTRGLGFNSEAAQAAQRQQQQQQQNADQGPSQGRKRGAGEPPDDSRRRAQQARGAAGDRVAALVREELASESLTDKVARHRQVMRAEQEQERGRAIDRYLRSAFNDPFDHLHSDNSNPLSRRHKLTDSNPLLDPIGD